MAAKIINLNQVRKQRARKASKARADENAVLYGRNASRKKADEAETRQRDATLDRSRVEMPPEDTDPDV